MTRGSMAAGRLALLLMAGGLAGAVFAGMTTGVMRPYREHAVRSDTSYTAPPAHQSWLDEGLSLLDSPAWPFGQGSDENAPMPSYPDTEGYGPEHYDGRGGYDGDRWQSDDPRGYRSHDGYDDPESGDGYPAQAQALAPSADRIVPIGTAQNVSRQADAASDAARRAATAAEDVIAAEHAN